MVGERGLEPPRPKRPQPPQGCASTTSATRPSWGYIGGTVSILTNLLSSNNYFWQVPFWVLKNPTGGRSRTRTYEPPRCKRGALTS